MFKGTLTPGPCDKDKKAPMVLSSENNNKVLRAYVKDYKSYFEKFNNDEDLLSLDVAIMWAIY